MGKMNIINFSNGIRSEEIQENFETLNGEINRERLSIGGIGIASGLEIVPIVTDTQFAIKVSAASIVDNDGEEVYIEEQIINIQRPNLAKQIEYLVADINNQIQLKEVPYMLNRVEPVQYANVYAETYSGINVKYQNSNNTDDFIRVKNVTGKTVTLTGLTRRQVVISYYSTAKRIDTVYIDNNYKLQVKSSSITSTTPSVVLPNSFKYLIAYIEIENEYMKDNNDTPHANISIKKDLRTPRNIYTDSSGILYICGIPFTDLHLIVTERPENPYPNQLWLDDTTATLYMWKATDKFVYKRSIELTSEHNAANGFIDFEANVDYYINRKQLKLYINSVELLESEYDEIFADLPVDIQSLPDGTKSKVFRVYTSMSAGDILTYTITFTESGFDWVPINKESFVNTKECKVYGVDSKWTNSNYWTSPQALALGSGEDGYPNKYNYFIFDAENDRNMFFSPGKNELEILINQVPLHRDQFQELTLSMIPSLPLDVRNAIANIYGWDEGKISNINKLYDSIGIGVILNNSLDSVYSEGLFDSSNQMINEKELYVEINVNRAVSNQNFKRKLQRTATFVYEDSITISDTFATDIHVGETFYRYKEHQLEVYLNGIRLLENVDYIEGTDLEFNQDIETGEIYEGSMASETSYLYRNRGAITRQFTMVKPLHIGDVINYKITTNFFSYDHINSLIDELETKQEAASSKVQVLYEQSTMLNDNTENAIADMKKQVAMLTGDTNGNLDKYLTKESIITEEQLDSNIIKRIPQSINHINHVITFGTYTSVGYDVSSILREEDFLLIWHRDVSNGNIDRMLLPDSDYMITTTIDTAGTVSVYLKLTTAALSNIKQQDKIIIRGMKFGRDGR